MSRQDVRERLRQAAWELYSERGYDRTTTAQIAARAGVTERTFFRHFPDKREVLFDGEAKVREALSAAIAAAPDTLGPLQTLLHAYQAIETMFVLDRASFEPRQAVIANTPALYERQLAKTASLTAAIATALRERGVDDRLASLAAQTGMAAFGHAAISWQQDPSISLATHLEHAFHALQSLSTGDSS